FQLLLQNVRNIGTQNGRVVAINNAFNNTANYFTTSQAYQLISLVSSQSNRLSLAKASYKTITDPQSFTGQMNGLITSQSRRRELANYIRDYDYANTNNNTNLHTPVSSTRFNEMYLAARQQWSASEKVNYISSLFSGTTNY